MAKIAYTDKEKVITRNNPAKNLGKADDFNEIKLVVNTNADIVSANSADIVTNTTDIAANTSGIATRDADIATNTANIATNVIDISTNAASIVTNANSASANAILIEDNTTDIGTLNTTVDGLVSVVDANATAIQTNDSDIGINATGIANNVIDIATNVTNISNNGSSISSNSSEIATNASNISTNTANIATNVTDIATNVTNIGTNDTDIATNAADIATNVTNIGTNTSGVATNVTNIGTNTTNIGTNTTDISTNTADIADLQLTNVVNINSASDFPAAVGGVRELVPVSGDSITYLIAADEIDMGSDRFTITEGEVVIRGVHRTASKITTTNATTMFTVVDSQFFQEYISFDCASADWVDYSAPVLAFATLANQNAIISACKSLGIISGAFVTSLRTMTVIDTSVGGFAWTGSDNSQINISDFLGLSWTGTLLDLGTATFSVINIGSGNRFLSPVGTTILSGAAASANFTASGRGIVDNNIFNGSGAPLNGIDTEDLKWDFENNIFANNSVKNTEVVAGTYLSASTSVTIGSVGVYVPIAGANWSTDLSKRFTVSAAGLVTYIGLETVDVLVTANSTVEKSGGGSDVICTKIAIGGAVADKTIGCTQSSDPTGVVSTGLFELTTGDTIQLFVGNEDSTANIIVSTSNMIISKR